MPRERREGFDGVAEGLVDAEQEVGAEAGGEEVAGEGDDLADGGEAEVMEGAQGSVIEANRDGRQGGEGGGEVGFAFDDDGAVGVGEGPGGAGGGGDREARGKAEVGEGFGEAGEEILRRPEEAAGAGGVEEDAP